MSIETIQDKKNISRITQQRRAANLLYKFAQKGFKSFNSLKTICLYYDKTLKVEEIKCFWQLNYLVDDELCNKVECVIDKLENE